VTNSLQSHLGAGYRSARRHRRALSSGSAK
jgi:hypothetical protein